MEPMMTGREPRECSRLPKRLPRHPPARNAQCSLCGTVARKRDCGARATLPTIRRVHLNRSSRHVASRLNMSMIGRSKKDGDTNTRNKDLTGPNDIYVIGSTMMSTELGEILETVNKSYLNLGFNKRYDDPNDPERFFYRSDHYNYAKKGIPIIFFFDGVHEDYHRAGDSPDKIDYQKMEKVTRTVYMTMWEIATRPTRPKVDKPLPAQLSTN